MLAREVTRWNQACDDRLKRLIAYINCTKHWVLKCHVGDKPQDLRLAVYADASFAGDTRDSKSTSGGLLCLVGPNTFVPLNWLCKKQTAVSHSSTEAEIISLESIMRVEGLPMLNLWSQILHVLSGTDPKKQVTLDAAMKEYYSVSLESVDYMPASLPPLVANTRLVMVEDNDAVIKMLKKGRAPSMAHVARTHRCNLDWLLERSLHDPCIYCRYIETKQQLADLLTKPHFSVRDWCSLCTQLRLGPPPPKKAACLVSDGAQARLSHGSSPSPSPPCSHSLSRDSSDATTTICLLYTSDAADE